MEGATVFIPAFIFLKLPLPPATSSQLLLVVQSTLPPVLSTINLYLNESDFKGASNVLIFNVTENFVSDFPILFTLNLCKAPFL